MIEGAILFWRKSNGNQPLAVSLSPTAGNTTADVSKERLFAQVKELSDQIDSYTTSADKYFGLVGTLGIGALAVVARPDGRSQVLNSILLASPLILLVILHYVAQLLTERGARVGIKRAIEDHLGRLDLKSEVQIESQLKEVVGQQRPSVIVSMFLYLLVVAGAVVGGFQAAADFDHHSFGRTSWSLLIGLVLMIIAVLISTVEMLRADRSGYRNTTARLKRCVF